MATTRTTISNSQSVIIAKRVAYMAIGKEMEAVTEVRKEAAEAAYQATIDRMASTPEQIRLMSSSIGLFYIKSALIHIEKRQGLAHEHSISIGYMHNGSSYSHHLSQEDQDALPNYISYDVLITEPDLIAAFREANKPYVALMEKHDAFVNDVVTQIDGRSAGSVIKTWPEIESIVCSVMCICPTLVITNKKPMITPFADLLAKLALALPAPATTTEEVA